MKTCTQCGESKLEKDDFYFIKNLSSKDYFDLICKKCRQNNAKENNRLIREWIEEVKTPCIKCNENRKHVIDFHHLDPSKKDVNISQYASSGAGLFETKKKKLKKEIEKCVTLCANCHRDFHYLEKTKNITFEEYKRSISPLPDTQLKE
jgi:protein-arginine kinase activator protein McsA